MQNIVEKVRSQIPKDVREICATLAKAGHGAWVVGGCVRDSILEKDVSDWDIASSATPEETMKLFRRVIPTGIDHGTVTVMRGEVAYEITTLRGEGTYSDGRRPDSVTFVRDIEDDLARRDFTVNAIAYDVFAETLIDPFAGLQDIERKRLRAVGVALERFQEDGLRILRGARFVATLDFELEKETEAAFGKTLDTFAKVSPERVREEWLKTMRAAQPSKAFAVMKRSGILSVVCPELLRQPEETWQRSLSALDAHRGQACERLAALFHAIGQPFELANNQVVDAQRSAEVSEMWTRKFRFSREETRLIRHLIAHQHISFATHDEVDVRRLIMRVGRADLAAYFRLLNAIHADNNERQSFLHSLEQECQLQLTAGHALSVGELAINGRDVIAILGAPSPKVGEILRECLEHVVRKPEGNTRDSLQRLVNKFANNAT